MTTEQPSDLEFTTDQKKEMEVEAMLKLLQKKYVSPENLKDLKFSWYPHKVGNKDGLYYRVGVEDVYRPYEILFDTETLKLAHVVKAYET